MLCSNESSKNLNRNLGIVRHAKWQDRIPNTEVLDICCIPAISHTNFVTSDTSSACVKSAVVTADSS